MIYFTADWHLGHDNIIKYCNRPFKHFQHMDKAIMKNYNGTVTDDDEVYFVGDLTMRGPVHKASIRAIVERMKGQKHLILGNHDRLNPFDYVDMGFISVHTSLVIDTFLTPELVLVHDPAISVIDRTKTFITAHVHDLYKVCKNSINVGVDVWDFHPVSLEQIAKIIKEEKIGGA